MPSIRLRTLICQSSIDKDPHWIVPPLLKSEFRNVLAAYIRRGMVLEQANQIMEYAIQTLRTGR
jgi:hypothetical protein